jgi:hypothetical protein
MSLYFSGAVWASLALCVCYSLGDQLPRYRTVATVASQPSGAVATVDAQPPTIVQRIFSK